jgi:hypothetical protein
MTSSKKTGGRDDWRTPKFILDAVTRAYGPIYLDPCAPPNAEHQFAQCNFTGGHDCVNGLMGNWCVAGKEPDLVYVNPPYSEMAAWSAQCVYWATKKVPIVVLVKNSRAKWFKAMRDKCSGLLEHPGRIRFEGGNGEPAMFDSVYILFNLDPRRLFDALGCTDEHSVYVPRMAA